MFKFFTTDPQRKLEKKYEALMSESYRLSISDRRMADQKYVEASKVLKQIENEFGNRILTSTHLLS